MADMNCPMCGKLNYDDMVECQHCGARLKPLIAPPESTPPQDQGEDWMQSLRDDSTDPSLEDEFEEDLPDWLEDEVESPSAAAADDSDEDWLSDIRTESASLLVDTGELEAEDADESWLDGPEDPDDGAPEGEALPDREQMPDWLKALDGPEDEEPEAQLPDWLTSSEPGLETPDPETAPESPAPLPDWLMSSAIESGESDPEPEPELQTPAEDLLDKGGAEAESPEPEAEPEEPPPPDWLSPSVFDSEDSEPVKKSPSTSILDSIISPVDKPERAEEQKPQDPVPDWLSSSAFESGESKPDPISGPEGSTAEAVPSPEPEEPAPTDEAEDVPDWLKAFESNAGTDIAGSSEDEEVPDWLNSFEAVESSPETESAEKGEDSEIPDWLTQFQEAEEDDEEEDPDSSEEEIPDWLKTFEPTEAPAAESPESEDEEEEIPDWLNTMDLGDAESPGEASAEGEDEEEIPDWLDAIGEAELPVPDPGEEPIENDIPDWLKSHTGEEIEAESGRVHSEWLTEKMAGPDQDADAVEGEVPEWLTGYSFEESTPPAEEESPEQISDGTDPILRDAEEDPGEDSSPDWLKEFESEAESIEEEPSSPAIVGLDSEDAPQEEVPDWLADVQASAGIPAPEGSEELSDPVAAWAFEDDSPTFADSADQDLDKLFDDSILPDWLSEDQDEEGEGEISQAGKKADDDDSIESGALPDWLEKMRPVESAESAFVATLADFDQVEGEVEKLGPLSGLRALLPAEPAAARTGTPGTYSVKLQITGKQQQNIELLQQMIATEQEPEAMGSSLAISPQHILRWLIAATLLLVIFFSLWTQQQTETLPVTTRAPGVVAAQKLVSSLENNAPVLVAFDYEPGYAPEIETAADGLIDNLMIKGARIAVISTSPIGPALGERFIREMQADHAYQLNTHYSNLGYISGGATGLLNFSIAPTEMIRFEYQENQRLFDFGDPNTTSVWQTEPLDGVRSLADFALTIVLTDDGDTARAWIEQVGPALRPNSLIMVVSAQTDPLIRPYFQQSNAQVAGLISGVYGGAAYENSLRLRSAREIWDTYGIALLIAQILILVGGAYNFALAFWKPGTKTGAAEVKRRNRRRRKS